MRKWVLISAVVTMLFACSKSEEEPATVSRGGGSFIGSEVAKPAPSPKSEMPEKLRESFLGGCEGEIKEAFGEAKARTMCTCMLDKGLAKWELGDFMKKAMEQGPEVEAISLECMKMALGVDAPSESGEAEAVAVEAKDESGAIQVKASFVEGCVKPMKDSFGAEKATGICTCMYDEGTSRWSLGDFMKKAVEQGNEIQEIAMKCMGADPVGTGAATEPESGTGGDIRATFVEGCVKPMADAFGEAKAKKICGCMFDKGTAKWDLGGFMKKAMEQGDEVQKIAMECVTGAL